MNIIRRVFCYVFEPDAQCCSMQRKRCGGTGCGGAVARWWRGGGTAISRREQLRQAAQEQSMKTTMTQRQRCCCTACSITVTDGQFAIAALTQRYRGVSSSALHQQMQCGQSREASSSNEWSHPAEFAGLRNYIQFYAVPEILQQRLQYLSRSALPHFSICCWSAHISIALRSTAQ